MLPSTLADKKVITNDELLLAVDLNRQRVGRTLDARRRSELGQYFTPMPTARLLASMFRKDWPEIRLLDAGAGVGSLTSTFVAWRFAQEANLFDDRLNAERPIYRLPARIHVTLFEQDAAFMPRLQTTLEFCRQECARHGVEFVADVYNEDFIAAAVDLLQQGLFRSRDAHFNCAILNPPYAKIHSKSQHRRLLRRVGIETGNLYTAFVALAADLLEPGGELVAITPRSFCNGPYFAPFRRHFFTSMRFRHIHVYDARNSAFEEDDVLQENIIFLAEKSSQPEPVLVTSSPTAALELTDVTTLEVDSAQIIRPDDPDLIVHIPTDKLQLDVLDYMAAFTHSLEDLGIAVSTGRVVDFRAKLYLRAMPDGDTVPLIYPAHFDHGYVSWPKLNQKKPNALTYAPETESLLLPSGYYVLVRRFSSKEEARRINAAIFDPDDFDTHSVAFENHLNVFHRANTGLPPEIARGLAVYLNSSLVDHYFRQFNGHTQVNATDLRMLPYPNLDALRRLGRGIDGDFPTQDAIDKRLRLEISNMPDAPTTDPLFAMTRIDEALEVIKALGLPRAQQNERSALTLLALLDIKPETPWREASAPLMGITPIMDYIRDRYGKNYAPNTRETIRRQTMHQFVEASIAVANPDDPARPINSPKWCYQVTPEALKLLRTYGTDAWDRALENYLDKVGTLQEHYAQKRKQRMIPVTLDGEQRITLTPGKHNELTKAIVEEFAPRFTPGGRVVYVGDTGDKFGYFDEAYLADLGVAIDTHGKMPDVVIHHVQKDWLLLIEAVTSHGPVDVKRRDELARLFAHARPGLVYVTAFLTRSDLAKYVSQISWATEAWIRENPGHLIHFDGDKFLGPYESAS